MNRQAAFLITVTHSVANSNSASDSATRAAATSGDAEGPGTPTGAWPTIGDRATQPVGDAATIVDTARHLRPGGRVTADGTAATAVDAAAEHQQNRPAATPHAPTHPLLIGITGPAHRSAATARAVSQ